jgi:arsenite methyltransferase
VAARENYGIDAPTVVRNLALGGIVALVCGWLIPGIPPALTPALRSSGIAMAVAALWMLASSLWLKALIMRAMVGSRQWSGRERVLDVGCGRGLVAIEAARRTVHGSVHAIDLWQSVDLSGNTPDALRANATVAGVAERLRIDTGDARKLPYQDNEFDVVTSMTAIHNIPDAQGRRAAIAEIWRVTRPGGQILIFDIRHARAYLRQLRDLGATQTKAWGPILLWGPIGCRLRATKP